MMFRKCMKNRNFRFGFFLLSIMFAIVFVSLFYTRYDPTEMDIVNKFQTPSFVHWLGTDNFGRDILSRVMNGSQVVFLVGITSVAIGLAGGFIIGTLAGFFGGMVDEVIMRIMDAQMAFPGILMALVFITVLGTGGINTAIAIGIASIPRYYRITRASFMQIRQLDYIKAAKSRGAGPLRLIFQHVLPNAVSPLIVSATLASQRRFCRKRGSVTWGWASSRLSPAGERCCTRRRRFC